MITKPVVYNCNKLNESCPPSMTRCFYGACIGKEKLCDGKSDCVDDSDENNCSGKLHICGMNEFKCTSGECISSENICDGVSHCLDKSDENEVLCEDDLCPDDAFHCNHGGCVHMDALCNGFKDCVDGSDETEIVCKMKNCGKNCDKVKENISCPPVFSERLNIICESKEGPKQGLVPCNKPASVGTIAKYGCKPFYVPAGSSQENNKQMVCQMDGKWSREALKCEPECGTRKPEATALIINGSVSKIGRWPWHATLYILEGGDWTYSCGGSLIHERAVLTGTAVCNGDSGGGLVFPKINDKEKWVLQGIVSVSPRRRGTSFCDPQYYTVFTKVGMYIDWISDVLKKIPIDVHPNDNVIDKNAL